MTNKLFIGSLAYTITDSQLEEHFSQAGQVTSAKVITDKFSGQGKGFGFVEMATVDEAKKAMKELNNTDLGGRVIIVKEAKPQENNTYRSPNQRKNSW